MAGPDRQPLLELRSVTKRFGRTCALDDVSLQLRAGEIHALVGENGAGKSTIIKIMTGLHRPDEGLLFLNSQPITLPDTLAAQHAGIAAIYQEPLVFPDLDVAENIFINHHDRGMLMHWRKLRQEARQLIDDLGVGLNVGDLASTLTLAEQQAIEIVRSLALDVKLLIMDEPTASLSAHESQRLLQIARSLRDKDVAVVYISHRLEEVFALADRVTVLRDGRHISTRTIGEASIDTVIKEMVGRELAAALHEHADHVFGKPLLSVHDLGRRAIFSGVDFQIREGEIVCLAGLVGARRTDVGLALFGIAPADTGSVELAGQQVRLGSVRQALDLGIAYASEDRRKFGLVMPMSITHNITMATIKDYLNHFGLLDREREREAAEGFRAQLNIRTPLVEATVATLSGGNQQKVMLAKWLNAKPRLLIVDEPTRGIDVGSKAEIHRMLRMLAKEGIAILVISSDMPEVLALGDTIVVMREGRQMGSFARAAATQERIMALATQQAAVAT